MAEEYKSLHPLKFYRDYLNQEIRPDGRAFDKYRPIIVNLGSIATCDGSSIVKLGKTSVVCGIKAELCKPKVETANQGFIVPNLELPPLCSRKFRPGPPSDQAQVLTQLIFDIVKNSRCIDLKKLCIFPDKLAWCLYIDLICLNFDGSVVDACVIALMSAIKSGTLPRVEYDPALDNIQVNTDIRDHLEVVSTPVSTTFAIFDDKIILIDPTVEEESLCTGMITVVIANDELCCVHKPGGSPLHEEVLLNCIETSKKRVPLITNLINTALRNQ